MIMLGIAYFRNIIVMVGISALILSGSVIYDLRFSHFGVPYDWHEIRQSGVLRVVAIDEDTVFVGQITRFAEEKNLEIRVRYCQSNDELWYYLVTFEADLAHLKNNDGKYSWTARYNSMELQDSVDLWYDRNVRYISKYDADFKECADSTGWDWKLLAAIGYVESKFKNVQSRGGLGVMQLSRNTANHFGASGGKVMKPHYNIMAAGNYIKYLERYLREVEDPIERHKFVMAAYNSGGKAVKAAMQRARENKKDPHKWSDVEPYYRSHHSKKYLKMILKRYDYYCEKE